MASKSTALYGAKYRKEARESWHAENNSFGYSQILFAQVGPIPYVDVTPTVHSGSFVVPASVMLDGSSTFSILCSGNVNSSETMNFPNGWKYRVTVGQSVLTEHTQMGIENGLHGGSASALYQYEYFAKFQYSPSTDQFWGYSRLWMYPQTTAIDPPSVWDAVGLRVGDAIRGITPVPDADGNFRIKTELGNDHSFIFGFAVMAQATTQFNAIDHK